MVGLGFPKHVPKDVKACDIQFGHEDLVEGGLVLGLEYGLQEVAVAFQTHCSCKKLEESIGMGVFSPLLRPPS